MRNHSLVLSYLLFLPLFCVASSSTATLSTAENLESLGIVGNLPDPFVAASPLIVAAVCSDGIALVAAHTVQSQEKLLREVCPEEEEEEEADKDGQAETDNAPTTTTFVDIWKDLPTHHGGPYRINRIDRSGTHMLSAGWRADCDLLTEKIRSLASDEVAVFGKPVWGRPYGRLLAQKASLWMAQLAVSDRYRPLSSAGLLATCTEKERKSGFQGFLWYLDATGAYPVRALAIGGGPAEGEKDGNLVVAQLVNAQLEKSDFTTMTAQEGVLHLLKILKDGPLVPSGCELEIAICGSSNRVQRPRLSDLSIPAEV